jgi:hypothetical protein
VMGQATPAGEIEFWLTRFKPGWAVDALRHTWPDFLLDAQFVSIWKDIDPCRLCFRVEGITAHLPGADRCASGHARRAGAAELGR